MYKRVYLMISKRNTLICFMYMHSAVNSDPLPLSLLPKKKKVFKRKTSCELRLPTTTVKMKNI